MLWSCKSSFNNIIKSTKYNEVFSTEYFQVCFKNKLRNFEAENLRILRTAEFLVKGYCASKEKRVYDFYLRGRS